MNKLNKANNVEALVQEYAQLSAQLESVKNRLEAVKTVLKESGLTEIITSDYKLNITEYETTSVSWQKIASKFEVSHQLKSAYTSHGVGYRFTLKNLK